MSTHVLISKFHIQAPKTGEWWEGKRGGEGRKGGGRIGIVAENRVGGERRGIGLDAKEWNIIPGSPGGRQTDRFLLR